MLNFSATIRDHFVKDPIPLVFVIVSTIIGITLIICVVIAGDTLTGPLVVSVNSLVAVSLFSIYAGLGKISLAKTASPDRHLVRNRSIATTFQTSAN